MVTVNTGRQVFEVLPAQLWKSLDPRDNGRVVQITSLDRLRVTVSNWKTKRISRIYLQDFVLRYEFMQNYGEGVK